MITITETAARKVKEVFKAQNKENAFLRLYLVGQSCSGPSFGMALEESKTNDDIMEQEHGISILADKKLTPHLEGAVVDYIEAVEGSGFEIRTAQSGNGCSSCGGSCC